ncbi:hypothetical protein LV28_03110 [Pandoraea pnomenusa]|uniref:Protein of uncharacterized function (DUF2964) n=1 Tax=Pandoraea pnomenusa TaxID=93220 RepID=A0A378YEU0_9BURK|nr:MULTISPECIES: DUF2964 family protein [Pandoraea]AHB78133.1 hypothetical protein X636_23890 [Pandoraea pnomenusa]AIM43968.1 hypothetical protein U875_25910 [Pandoraea pnomenusa 3kgm]AIU25659.1 hypothetical protein LV28_03110 [Pandoraea pnomenusa]ANC46792.1 hypothetical protein A6P55_24120 [Pandoraea pnomenusa]MBN9093770.1 DUF2964 family protein [Pandoraea pnomenusa]
MCSDLRVAIASITSFVMLGGIFATIHGLLFNLPDVSRYGVAAVLLGATCTATMLIPWGARDQT